MEIFDGKNRISRFNYDWKFTKDVLPLTARYAKRFSAYSVTRAGERCPYAKAGFNDSEWKTLDVPHDWLVEEPYEKNELDAHGYKKKGTAWYRKEFKLDVGCEGKQIILRFEGVAGNSEIYVNGSLLKRNFSKFNEFTVDVTDRVFFGNTANAVAVFVDSSDIEIWAYEGAGIYRNVDLIIKDSVNITENGIWIKPEKKSGDKWNVFCEVTVHNNGYTDMPVKIVGVLTAPDGKETGKIEINGIAAQNGDTKFTADTEIESPEIWDPEHPSLYTARFTAEGKDFTDSDETVFGFRTYSIDKDNGFILNGRPYKLYGVCLHQNHACVGSAITKSLVDFRMKKIVGMGANAIRLTHHTVDRDVIDFCDRNGIVVMSENRSFETEEENLNRLREQLRRDRNHPSIMLYVVFNEEPIARTKQGCNIYNRLRAVINEMDGTRILTGSMNDRSPFAAKGVSRLLDVTGLNYSLGDYEDFRALYPDRPLIGSENIASFSTRGIFETDLDNRMIASNDTERKVGFNGIRETFSVIAETPWIAGMFAWAAFDYRGEAQPLNWPAVTNHFGFMDLCGFEKGNYYYFRAFRDKDPLVRIIQHWNHKKGDPVKVGTVTNCEKIELLLNGKSLGIRDNDVYKQQYWDVTFTPGTLTAIGYNGGKEAARDEIVTSGAAYRIVLEADRDTMSGDRYDTLPITVSAVDRSGNPVLTADNHIEFTVEDGQFMGCANGNPVDHNPDTIPERDLFNGLAQLMIRADGSSDEVTVTASSKGLRAAEIKIRVL